MKKIKLRCSTKDCRMRSGFFVNENQANTYMRKKCGYCGQQIIYIRLAEDKK